MSERTAGHPLTVLTAILSLSLLVACDIGSQGTGGAPSDASQQGAGATLRDRARNAASSDAGLKRAVVAETLPYAEVDEELVYGHFVFPADMVDPLPGVIVIHEWWGLNDDVRAMADRVAAEGYVVLAVDLFGGVSTKSPGDARAMMVRVIENPELADENMRQAYQFLVDSGQAPRIGALGWDFGGGWSLNTAILFPDDLDAAVIYYGQVTNDQDRLEPIDVPILGLFGANDRGIPVKNVREFEEALEILGKNYQIEIYPNARHAFANPTSPNFNPAVAERAWTRTVEFLDRHLSVTVD